MIVCPQLRRVGEMEKRDMGRGREDEVAHDDWVRGECWAAREGQNWGDDRMMTDGVRRTREKTHQKCYQVLASS